METLFLLVKNKWIFLRVLSGWRENEQLLSKNCRLQKFMANFETVKMLAKEVPFLLENVLRIRFHLNSKLCQDYKNYFRKKKMQTENLIVLPL